MLRYKDELSSISKTGVTCPPLTATNSTREAWRWTFSPFSANCFLPVAKRNPARLVRANAPDEQCSCWALSMHQTEKDSILAFHAVEKSFKKARQTLGTHVATGVLNGDHGLSTSANAHGHFDLHPYLNAEFDNTFTIHAPIPVPTKGTQP